LIDGTEKVTESDAVLIYIAHKSGKTELLGKNAKDQVTAATVRGVCKDIMQEIGKAAGDKDAAEKKLEELFAGKYGEKLKQINKHLEGKKWVVGDYVTYSDFILYLVTRISTGLYPKSTEGLDNLNKHVENFKALPELKNYFTNDKPQPMFPPMMKVNVTW